MAGWGLVSAAILMLMCPVAVVACQVEYSDWLVNVFRQQGMHLDKRVGHYASLAECEDAMRRAVSQSGDPNLANNMRCVDCMQPTVAPQPPAAPQLPQGGWSQDTGETEAREKERQEAFNRERQDLLRKL